MSLRTICSGTFCNLSCGPATHAHPRPNGSWNGAPFCAGPILVSSFGPRCMGMTRHMTDIHHEPFIIRFGTQRFSHSSHIPLSRQRQKRRWVFFQSPSSGGTSRHGAPVLNIQHTAFKHNRFSLALPHPIPSRPGSRSFTISQVRSEMSCRRCANPPIDSSFFNWIRHFYHLSRDDTI